MSLRYRQWQKAQLHFYEFGDDVLYEILIDNDGDARANMSTHEHTHLAVEEPPGPSEGAVFIEVGEGVEAAVVYTEPDLDGAELEIRPASEK